MYRLLLAVFLAFCNADAGAQSPTAEAPASDKSVMVSHRPDPEGIPTPVEVRMFIVDVSSINNVEQEFSADIYVTATWKDSRLEGTSTRTLPLADVWHPPLTVVNERSLEDLLPQVVTVEPDGTVTYAQRLIGRLSARMDLREFPHDRQTLSVSIIAIGLSPEEIELRPVSQSTEGFQEFTISDWQITLESAEAKPLLVPSTGQRRAHVVFQIGAERNVGFYMWVMYVPLVLIVFMAWMVFWIDPSLIPSQIALSTASVFSLIAFRFTIRLALPAVSYMTRMDKFVLGCTVLVFLALAQAVMTGRLSKQGRDVLARRMDQWGRWIYLGAFVAIAVIYL